MILRRSLHSGVDMMAAKKKEEKVELLPFDELPIAVKRNRRLLYEYIRTGDLPD